MVVDETVVQIQCGRFVGVDVARVSPARRGKSAIHLTMVVEEASHAGVHVVAPWVSNGKNTRSES